MADNFQVNASTQPNGPTYRDRDRAGVRTQVVIIDRGGAGAEDLSPLDGTDGATPPTIAGTGIRGWLRGIYERLGATLGITGTVALDGPTLAALETIQVGNFPATQPVSGTVALDSASLAALESISVQNFPATQAVSGPLTNTELRATAVPVSGSVGLADGANTAQITASREQVVALKDAISATQNITALDAASTSATGQSGQSIISGTPTAGSAAVLSVTGESSFAIQVDGTWTGTLQFERSLDGGLTYTSIGAFAAGTAFVVTTITANGRFHGNSSSATTLRVRAVAAMTGTASVQILAGAGAGTITIGNPVRLYRDAGRQLMTLRMDIPVVTTATDALQSLTGFTNGAVVAATTTPAVIPAGKVFHLQSAIVTYVAIATAGSVKFTIRANTAGLVALASPAVDSWVVGGPAAVAGVSQTVLIDFPDGFQFAAGTGIGVSMVGLNATQAAAAVGYGKISLAGYLANAN